MSLEIASTSLNCGGAADVVVYVARQRNSKYQLLNREQLMALQPMDWLVRNVIPARGLVVVYGQSRAGKSFLVFDLIAAIAEGESWFGYSVKQAPVVYVALEGEAGIQHRGKAWEAFKGRNLPANMHVILQAFALNNEDDISELVDVVPTGAVVVIDTLNRASPGSDENAPKDMGLIIQAATALQFATQGPVIIVHHTGKGRGKGPRGHSSLIGAIDVGIEVVRSGTQRSWTLDKNKDGPDGQKHNFSLLTKVVGVDEDGEDVASCVVVPGVSGQSLSTVRTPKGKHQIAVMAKLREMLQSAPAISRLILPVAYPPGRPAIALTASLSELAAALDCPSDKRTSYAKTAINALVTNGLLALGDDWLWLP